MIFVRSSIAVLHVIVLVAGCAVYRSPASSPAATAPRRPVDATGAQTSTEQPPSTGTRVQASQGSTIDVAVASCRVAVARKVRCTPQGCDYETDWGSGTLIAPGRVLTCSHLFNDGMDELTVYFAGKPYRARLLKRDPGPDFALLAVEGVTVRPTGYVDVLFEAQPITLCGFGGGQFRKSTGYFKRWAAPSNGRHSFSVNVRNRDGDSGGGAFNADGRLIGVQWGCPDAGDPEGTFISSGEGLVKFLWGEQ